MSTKKEEVIEELPEGNVFIELGERIPLRAIGTDSYQWIVYKRHEKVDGTYSGYRPYKYCATLEGTAKLLTDELIRTCGAQSFAELNKAVKLIEATMLAVFQQAETITK